MNSYNILMSNPDRTGGARCDKCAGAVRAHPTWMEPDIRDNLGL